PAHRGADGLARRWAATASPRPAVPRRRDPRRLHNLLDVRAGPARAARPPPSGERRGVPPADPRRRRARRPGRAASDRGPRTRARRGGDPRMIGVLVVAAGAAVGAPLRYLTDRAVQGRHDSAFPFGTLTVNLLASLVLGLVTGLSGVSTTVLALVGAGF